MAVTSPPLLLHWGREGPKGPPTRRNAQQRRYSAGGGSQNGGRGDGGDGGDGCGSGGPWKSTVEAVVTVPRWTCPCGASGESGRERAGASMVAHSGAVMATGVAVVMGKVIAAAAVIGWRLGGGGGLIRPRAASTIYLLKGRGRGRVVTQRCFGPMRSLAAPSAATFKVAASGAAHERLSPTRGRAGRAGRVVRMGQERGVHGGLGRGGEPRRQV